MAHYLTAGEIDKDIHDGYSCDLTTLVSLTGLQAFATTDDVLDFYRGREPLLFLPKADFHGEQLVMLYPGDAGYELQDPADISLQHRCLHTPNGWHYIREKAVR